MATSEVVSAPASAFPVNNKLQRKVNVLREVIESEKLEVRRIGREMRESISRKEEEVIRGLDAVWESVNARIEEKKREVEKCIKKIKENEEEMKKIYQKTESLFKNVKHTLPPQTLPQFSEEIEAVKRDMDIPIPYVKVTWRVDGLRESINRMCHCEEQIREITSYQKKWSKCKDGVGESELYSPHGIAINSLNDTIYVTDWYLNRIQIFSNDGKWIKSFENKEIIKPENIIFLSNSIYVQCERRIFKFNEFSEKLEKYISYDFPLRGICTDKTNIFIGNYSVMKLILLTADLTEEKQITLNTEFYQQGLTEIRDLSISEEEIYVLLSDSEYPIQSFSKEGILSRCVIQKDSIGETWYFCIDQQLNLIVSDRGECCVKIFSNEGTLLTRLFSSQGGYLSGVNVDKLGSVLAGLDPYVCLDAEHICPFFLLHQFS